MTIEALRLAFPSASRGPRFVALLTAYFDESGTHEGAPALSVAGYVATVEQWEAFEREWRQGLKIYGLDYFHMVDFSQGKGPFGKWPKAKRMPRLFKMINIVNRHAAAAIGAVIPMDVYRSLSPESRAACHTPYRVAAMQCCLEMSRWVKTAYPKAEIAYVFEAGAHGAGRVSDFFLKAMQDEKARNILKIMSIRFENKRQFLPLQAADILAYELYTDAPRILKLHPRPPREEIFNALSKAKFSAFKYPTKDHLQAVVDDIIGMGLAAGKTSSSRTAK